MNKLRTLIALFLIAGFTGVKAQEGQLRPHLPIR
jgi:hypothetical protein